MYGLDVAVFSGNRQLRKYVCLNASLSLSQSVITSVLVRHTCLVWLWLDTHPPKIFFFLSFSFPPPFVCLFLSCLMRNNTLYEAAWPRSGVVHYMSYKRGRGLEGSLSKTIQKHKPRPLSFPVIWCALLFSPRPQSFISIWVSYARVHTGEHSNTHCELSAVWLALDVRKWTLRVQSAPL